MNLFREAYVGSSLFLRLIWLLLSVVLFFLVIMISGLLAGILFFDLPYAGMMAALSDVSHPQHLGLMRYIQGVQTLALFIVPSLWLAWLLSGRPLKYLKMLQAPGWMNLFWTLLALLCLLIPINYLASLNEAVSFPDSLQGLEYWMRGLEDRTQEVLDRFLNVSSPVDLLLNILIVAVLAGLGEELFFRGILQPLIIRISGHVFWGVLLTSVLFSVVHFQFFGFLPRMLMGMFLGYLLVWTGSLWIPIFAHFVNNLLGILLAYGIFNELIPADTESFFSDSRFWPLWAVATILGIVFMTRLHKRLP